MKIGMNLLLWTGGVTAEHFPLLGKLKDSGVPLATGFAYCALPALLAAILMCWVRPASRDRGEAGST